MHLKNDIYNGQLAVTRSQLIAYNQEFLQQQQQLKHTVDLEALSVFNYKQDKPQAKCKDPRMKAVKVRMGNGQTVDYLSYIDFADEEKEFEAEGKVIGSLAIIEIEGFIRRKNPYWWWSGGLGTDDVREMLKLVGNDKTIKGVILQINSGGGMVEGTETLANDIYGFLNKYGKRIYAVVEGMAMSAAYWLASQADYIYATETVAKVGSIGTMVTLVDSSAALELMGYRVIEVYAPLSIDKNQAVEQAIQGDTTKLQNLLAKANNSFVGAVIRGRKKRMNIPNDLQAESLTADNAPEQFLGTEYLSADAIAAGLIDEVRSFDSIIDLISRRTSTNFEQPQAMPNTFIIRNGKIEKAMESSTAQQRQDSTPIEPPTAGLNPLKSLFKS